MLKAGILGGGQLGRMLLQAAANYPVQTYVMESDPNAPAAHLCHRFVKGDIRDFDAVYSFGKDLDALTIEIESVNEDALEALEQVGVKVYPSAAALRIIKNKIRQKEFYQQQGVPSPDFVVTADRSALRSQQSFLPAVHKIAEGGYDGRGVQLIRQATDIEKGFDAPSVLEKLVAINKEISQIVAVDRHGNTVLYPPVDMVFDPELNLLDYQISPAALPDSILRVVSDTALKVVKGLNSAGIFAVELFVDHNGAVFVNETAPRVHNSGHHTIEANFSSQFDMLWRILLGYPLGNPRPILPAAIVNLLGEPGHSGPAAYDGLEKVLQMEQAFVHLYGKAETRPGRKMGHVTLMHRETEELVRSAAGVKQQLKVISLE